MTSGCTPAWGSLKQRQPLTSPIQSLRCHPPLSDLLLPSCLPSCMKSHFTPLPLSFTPPSLLSLPLARPLSSLPFPRGSQLIVSRALQQAGFSTESDLSFADVMKVSIGSGARCRWFTALQSHHSVHPLPLSRTAALSSCPSHLIRSVAHTVWRPCSVWAPPHHMAPGCHLPLAGTAWI